MVAFFQPNSSLIDFDEARLEVLAKAGCQIPARWQKWVLLKRDLVNFYFEHVFARVGHTEFMIGFGDVRNYGT